MRTPDGGRGFTTVNPWLGTQAWQVAIEMPYEEAHTLFSDLTGVPLGSERLHTFVHQAAEEL